MLYEIQTEVQTIPILHLYCGAYEMGRAQGTDSLINPINMRRRLTVNANIFMGSMGRAFNTTIIFFMKICLKSFIGTLMKNRIMKFYTELEEYTIGIYSEKIRDYVRSRYPTLAGMNKQISK